MPHSHSSIENMVLRLRGYPDSCVSTLHTSLLTASVKRADNDILVRPV